MAYYKAGDIIRLTRQASGISQEELSFEICSTETLSRLENGKHKVKIETYRRLMDKMGRCGEKIYAICTSDEMEILQEKTLLEDAVAKRDYTKAWKYLNILKEKVSDNILNKQYVKRVEILFQSYDKKISNEDLIREMEKVISLTIVNYNDYLDSFYPYTEEEILILMNLANKYNKINYVDKSIKIYKMLLRCLELNYINGIRQKQTKIIILRNLSSLYGNMENYEESNELGMQALKLAVECDYGYMIPIILEDISWNLRNKKCICIEKEEEIKKIMRQAYYIAAARNDDKIKEIILNSFRKTYNEEM